MISADVMTECLRVQREMHAAGVRPVPRLEELLVRKGLCTTQDIARALAERKREIRYCPRCQVVIMVEVRPDGSLHRCGDCQGPLILPPESAKISASDSSFVNLSRDPVPPDVQALMENRSARFGKYILLRELGRGGVGVVYQAWDTYLVQYVAIKRIQSDLGHAGGDREGRIQSLIKEARSAIRLRHPGIVTLYDIGRINREFYISMEFIEGETLERRLLFSQRLGRPSPFFENARSLLRILSGTARAVHYAHTRPQPIVHCDLKPGNILIDGKDRPHVLDFGLARNLRVKADDNEKVAGSPAYMAPEQIMGNFQEIDARSDVYALGAILYEVLTGTPPFYGDVKSILGRALAEAPRPPGAVLKERLNGGGPGIPPELEQLCLRCLEKEQSRRPQSMEEAAQVIERTEKAMNKTTRMEKAVTRRTVAPPAPAPPPAPEPAAAAVTQLAPQPPPPPASPPPPRREGARRLLIGLLLCGLILACAFAVWKLKPGSNEASDGPLAGREAEILAQVAAFRPDLASASAKAFRGEAAGTPYEEWAGILIEEAAWVSRLRDRMIARISSVRLSRLRLRGGASVETTGIKSADEKSLRPAGTERSVGWGELEPLQVVELVGLALPQPDGADRLAIGIFCARAGLAEEAKRALVSLRGSSLEVTADRYLLILNQAR